MSEQHKKRPVAMLTAVPRHASALLLPSGVPLGKLARDELLMAQHVEVGIVFQMMLGDAEAIAYFRSVGVPDSVASRVLTQPHLLRRLYDANGVRLPAPAAGVGTGATAQPGQATPSRAAPVLLLVHSA